MANVQYYDVILKPVVTEKTMELMGDKKYTFLVHPEATKSQIKEAVEKMFDGTKVAKGGIRLGILTFQNVCHAVAPSTLAASM